MISYFKCTLNGKVYATIMLNKIPTLSSLAMCKCSYLIYEHTIVIENIRDLDDKIITEQILEGEYHLHCMQLLKDGAISVDEIK